MSAEGLALGRELPHGPDFSCLRVLKLVALVLVFMASAVINRVANRILLVPMSQHTKFLALATSVVQFAAFGGALAWQVQRGKVTGAMWRFAAAEWPLLCCMGVCEGGFYPVEFAAAARLPGGLIQVLNQSVVPFTVFFSALLMGQRFDVVQLLGVATVLGGVWFAGLHCNSDGWQVAPGNVALSLCAFALLALAFVLKDIAFRRFRRSAGPLGPLQELDVALVCACAAAAQLGTQLLGWFVLMVALPTRASGAADTLGSGLAALLAKGDPPPWSLAVVYWAMNVSFTLSALQLVRQATAAWVVLANVAALPLSALVFCCPLPLLIPQAFKWYFLASLGLVVLGNLLYGHAAFGRGRSPELEALATA